MRKTRWRYLFILLVSVLLPQSSSGQSPSPSPLETPLPAYTAPAYSVFGQVWVVGTMATESLVKAWSASLSRRLPGLLIEPQDFISLQTNVWWTRTYPLTLAVLDSPMSDAARQSFVQQFGYQPTRLQVAWDALAVIVQSNHPLLTRGLTLAEVDAIFSSTLYRRHPLIQYWGELGLNSLWERSLINVYGPDVSSSLFMAFQQQVLGNGSLKASVLRQPSAAAVVEAVGNHFNAIGYTGRSSLNAKAAAVPLARGPGQRAFSPTPANIYAQEYPFGLPIYIYCNVPPGKEIAVPLREFLRFVYSQQGQDIASQQGYIPLPGPIAMQALRTLGL